MSDSELKGKGCVCVCALSRVWLWDPTDCTLSGSSVHGSFLATILEWVTISPCKVSSWPRDWTSFSFICRQTAFQLSYLGNSKGKCTGGKFPVVRLVKNFNARGSQETIFWNAEGFPQHAWSLTEIPKESASRRQRSLWHKAFKSGHILRIAYALMLFIFINISMRNNCIYTDKVCMCYWRGVCIYIYKTYNKPTLLTQLYINTWASWGLIWKRICLQCRRLRFDPEVGKIPWRREWLPTPVFWPGESHGQRSLVGYHAWCRKESDTTEWLTLTILIHTRERESVHVSVWEKVLYIQRLLSLTARNKVSWKATKKMKSLSRTGAQGKRFYF